MHPFDDISSSELELELGLEDDVLLTNMTMTSQPRVRYHDYPTPRWMQHPQSSFFSLSSSWEIISSLLLYLRDTVYPFVIRCTSRLFTYFFSRGILIIPTITTFFRPRLTVRYVALTSLTLYTLYRWLTSQPLLASRLPPTYTGPHDVGAVDIEIPLAAPRRVSDLCFRDGTPAFEVETVLFTMYYPTRRAGAMDVVGSASGHDETGIMYWIPKPISATARGYARFLGMDNFVARNLLTLGLWIVAPWGIRIPAKVGAPLLPAAAVAEVGPDALGYKKGREEQEEEEEEEEEQKEEGKLPIMVFSHGMLSSRTDYTSYLGELASRGMVVAALEHRDGSSPASAIRKKGQPDKWRYWFGLKDLDDGSSSSRSSGDEKPDVPILKEAQLAFREAEIEATVTILRQLDAGSDAIAKQNPRQPVRKGRPPPLLVDFLSGFQNRLNTTHLTLAGHSYGGTGVLRALRSQDNNNNNNIDKNNDKHGLSSPERSAFTGAIILDPGKSSGPLNDDISVPIIVCHSASWSRPHGTLFFGRPHFDVVRELVEGVNKRCGSHHRHYNHRMIEGTDNDDDDDVDKEGEDHGGDGKCDAQGWFLTSLGTSHPSITDAPLLEPLLLSWTTGSTMNAKMGIQQYVDLTRDFVRFQHTGKRQRLLALSASENEGLLSREYDPKHNPGMPEIWRKYWQIHIAPD